MRLKPLILIPAVALAICAAVASATPAAAAASACPAGKFCIFQDTEFGGELFVADSNCHSNLSGESYPGNYPGVNDSASSIVNNTSQRVRLFENTNYGGRYIDVQANAKITNLKNNSFVIYNNDGSTNQILGAFNDVISSFCPR